MIRDSRPSFASVDAFSRVAQPETAASATARARLVRARDKATCPEVIARSQRVVRRVVLGDRDEMVRAPLATPLEPETMRTLRHAHAGLRRLSDGPPVDVDRCERHGVDADAPRLG